jgi:ketosteroid isomerase-like protein
VISSIRNAFVLASVPVVLSAQSPVRHQADSLLTAMVAAFKVDKAATAKFYTDDAALIGGGSRVVGREGVNRYWAGTTPGSTWRLELIDAGGDANAPWAAGRSWFATPGGQPFLTEFLGILQRGQDGQLRFRVDAYTAATGTLPATTTADVAAVRKLDSLWARMYQTHDTASALQLYADGLVFVSANGRQKTRAEELADVRPAAGLTMDYFRTTPAEVRTFEKMAVVRGTAEWRFAMNGSPRDVRRTYTAVYSRGGPLGWRIVAMQMGAAP